MQLFEDRNQADDAAKATDPLHQHHELTMLGYEFVVYLLERRVQFYGTRKF
jgi:hypothetical protein